MKHSPVNGCYHHSEMTTGTTYSQIGGKDYCR